MCRCVTAETSAGQHPHQGNQTDKCSNKVKHTQRFSLNPQITFCVKKTDLCSTLLLIEPLKSLLLLWIPPYFNLKKGIGVIFTLYISMPNHKHSTFCNYIKSNALLWLQNLKPDASGVFLSLFKIFWNIDLNSKHWFNWETAVGNRKKPLLATCETVITNVF